VAFRKLRRRSPVDSNTPGVPLLKSEAAMSPVRKSDISVQIMLAEIADLTKAMREFLMTVDRYVYFGGLVAVAAITVGIINHNNSRDGLVLIFAPYAIGITFMYILQIFTEIERRAGYKRFLEDQVRRQLGTAVLLDSDVSSWAAKNRVSTWGGQFLNGAALAAFIYLSIQQTRRYDTRGPSVNSIHLWNLHYLNIIGLAVLVLVLAAAASESLRASNRAYEAASVAYKRYSSP
jgi:hypothetical protein